jgi:hypothetical protein
MNSYPLKLWYLEDVSYSAPFKMWLRVRKLILINSPKQIYVDTNSPVCFSAFSCKAYWAIPFRN